MSNSQLLLSFNHADHIGSLVVKCLGVGLVLPN